MMLKLKTKNRFIMSENASVLSVYLSQSLSFTLSLSLCLSLCLCLTLSVYKLNHPKSPFKIKSKKKNNKKNLNKEYNNFAHPFVSLFLCIFFHYFCLWNPMCYLCAHHYVLIKPISPDPRFPNVCVLSCVLLRSLPFPFSVVFFSQCIRRWRALGAWPLSRLQ